MGWFHGVWQAEAPIRFRELSDDELREIAENRVCRALGAERRAWHLLSDEGKRLTRRAQFEAYCDLRDLGAVGAAQWALESFRALSTTGGDA